MSKTCDVRDCTSPATHRAELVIYAAVAHVHPPAIGQIGIQVCDAHADEGHARMLMSADMQRKTETSFARIGRARPDWSRSFVRWVKEEHSRE
jgi:4-hydroxyphenylpyruvate dioxygenase-like putative hemolysin